MVRKLLIIIYIIWLLDRADGIIRNNARYIGHQYKNSVVDSTINKVSLTQKGYIQFLKYIETVPPLTDYTFCIWVRSSNLTYSHPILSYSKHEEERLIRVWISPLGESINLEILGHPVFEIPVDIVEGHWYHICQSWSSYQASWNLYINGKLRSNGYQPELKGLIIKGDGDIVVGQEYTDFDKGLEDGIEGDVFGFNFVLASTSPYLKPLSNNFLKKKFQLSRKPQSYEKAIPHDLYSSIKVPQKPIADNTKSDGEDISGIVEESHSELKSHEVPDVLSYFNTEPSRNPKGLLDVFKNALGFFYDEPERVKVVYHPKPMFRNQPVSRSSGQYNIYEEPTFKYLNGRPSYRKVQMSGSSRILNDFDGIRRPLGLLLVELSFDCGLKKGAPVSGEGVLINWTKTPVRVFGGAILKSVPPFCT